MYLLLSIATAGTCTPSTLSELAATPSPAVFVLGERKGTQPDLWRATRLVSKLRATGEPITVGLQSIPTTKQPVLDRYANGEIASEALADHLDWNSAWGFPWAPYRQLVQGAIHDDRVVGVGVPFEMQPKGTINPRPPGYLKILSDTMSGHYLPTELEPAFVQSVSWFDHRTAMEAMQNWNGKGFLVVIADRLHVEGGRGISWQLQRLVEAPVYTVNLGGSGGCYAGDLYLGR